MRVVSLYIVIGLAGWGGSLLLPADTPSLTAAIASVDEPPKAKIVSTQIISGTPMRFTIERLAIDLPVNNGYYDSKTDEWTLSDDAVYFATITSRPNDNKGNTFIYGHNQPQVIANMKDIRVGDVVEVTTTNDRVFRYSYVRDAIVTPEFTAVLDEDPSKPQLTVMTCEGIWSAERRLMYFDLLEVL